MKKLKKLSLFEIIAYCVLLLVGLWGLVYICLGVAVEFISTKTAVAKADAVLVSTFKIGFLWSGLIILGSAVVVAAIILLINAKKSDRDFEKAQRRAARLKKKDDVVDVESTPVEEAEVKEE